MKKILIALSIVASSVTISTAAEGYGAAGCGLGALIFGDEPGGVQILAATTNSTYGNQTFGITSGTSNCTDDPVALKEMELQHFAETNLESLNQEVAQGQGENLEAFGLMLGCDSEHITLFSNSMQSQYEQIIPSDASGETLLKQVRNVIAKDEALSNACAES